MPTIIKNLFYRSTPPTQGCLPCVRTQPLINEAEQAANKSLLTLIKGQIDKNPVKKDLFLFVVKFLQANQGKPIEPVIRHYVQTTFGCTEDALDRLIGWTTQRSCLHYFYTESALEFLNDLGYKNLDNLPFILRDYSHQSFFKHPRILAYAESQAPNDRQSFDIKHFSALLAQLHKMVVEPETTAAQREIHRTLGRWHAALRNGSLTEKRRCLEELATVKKSLKDMADGKGPYHLKDCIRDYFNALPKPKGPQNKDPAPEPQNSAELVTEATTRNDVPACHLWSLVFEDVKIDFKIPEDMENSLQDQTQKDSQQCAADLVSLFPQALLVRNTSQIDATLKVIDAYFREGRDPPAVYQDLQKDLQSHYFPQASLDFLKTRIYLYLGHQDAACEIALDKRTNQEQFLEEAIKNGDPGRFGLLNLICEGSALTEQIPLLLPQKPVDPNTESSLGTCKDLLITNPNFDPNRPNKDGYPALFLAMQQPQSGCWQAQFHFIQSLLLRPDVRLDVKDPKGNTPLLAFSQMTPQALTPEELSHWHEAYYDVYAILLIQSRAVLNAVNHLGESAITHVSKVGKEVCFKALRQEANLKNQVPPFFKALMDLKKKSTNFEQTFATLQRILDEGASMAIWDNKNQKPLLALINTKPLATMSAENRKIWDCSYRKIALQVLKKSMKETDAETAREIWRGCDNTTPGLPILRKVVLDSDAWWTQALLYYAPENIQNDVAALDSPIIRDSNIQQYLCLFEVFGSRIFKLEEDTLEFRVAANDLLFAKNRRPAIFEAIKQYVSVAAPNFRVFGRREGDLRWRRAIAALLTQGANINHFTSSGRTPLVYAIECNAREIVLDLLGYPDLDMTVKNQQGKSQADRVLNAINNLSDKQPTKTYKELAKTYEDWLTLFSQEYGPKFYADPFYKDLEGNSPLFLILSEFQALEKSLKKPLELKRYLHLIHTILHTFKGLGNQKINSRGETFLIALIRGRPAQTSSKENEYFKAYAELETLAIKHCQATINTPDGQEGYTPLMWAILTDNVHCTLLLTESQGIDWYAKTPGGQTAADILEDLRRQQNPSPGDHALPPLRPHFKVLGIKGIPPLLG